MSLPPTTIQPTSCPHCGLPHDQSDVGPGAQPRLVVALRAGCPRASTLLVDAVLAQVLTRRPWLATDGLRGPCWLLLAEWPATRADLVERVAERLLRDPDEATSRPGAPLPRRVPARGAAHPVETPAALLRRACRLGLLTRDEALLLWQLQVWGLGCGELAHQLGTSPEVVRMRRHRLLRRLASRRTLLVASERVVDEALRAA